ncbi:MAG TPA: hypothetical protein VF720_02810, partial [Candidatus Eisenbacteria bacterium]
YWGPNGMAFFRNVQFRWMPFKGDSRVTFALERPGASGDQGDYADRVELSDIQGNFPVPDFSAEARKAGSFGYVELAGIVRRIEWEDLNDDGVDLSDGTTGWGLSGSSNLKLGGKTTARLQAVVGEGIENYMNDAPVDVAIEADDDEEAGFKGVALPMVGISAFIDHNWSPKFSSSFGYSQLEIDNSDGQSANAFKLGQYALANIMYYPTANVMMGVEGGWIRRENFEDAFDSDNTHVQFSFKYNFSTGIGTR